jgi:hypothetical protein
VRAAGLLAAPLARLEACAHETGGNVMLLQTVRFVTIVLAALSLTLESAHALELPQKMSWTAELYSTVNSTLYRYFAVVGGSWQLGAIVAAGVLTILVRKDRAVFRWTLAGLVGLVLAFAAWLVIVAPVNGEVAQVSLEAPAMLPATWLRLRPRWEYGHLAGFVLQLAGFCCLVLSLLVREATAPGASGSEGR